MGLTLLSFISALLLFLMVPAVLRRGRHESSGVFIALLNLFLSLFTLFHGFVEPVSELGESPISLLFSRLSSSSLALALICLVVVSLSFPRWPGLWAKLVAVLVGLVGILTTVVEMGTDRYMQMIFGVGGGVVRYVGTDYNLIIDSISLLAFASALVNLTRGLLTKDTINRQRSIFAAIGTGFGVLCVWFFGRILAGIESQAIGLPVLWSYYFLPLSALIVGASSSYALFVSVVFDWGILARRLLSYLILALFFGAPAGAIVYALVVMGSLSNLIPILGTPVVFFIAWRLATGFAEHRLERVLKGILAHEYRENLESGLSHVDLSAGRDAVIAEVHELLRSSLELEDFAVLIEDDRGTYKTVFSSEGRSASLERGSKVHEVVESAGVSVLLKTEALADPAFAEIRSDLVGFFDLFKGEAMIFAREGRHIIGAFILGGRRTGSDYTNYDREAFQAINGKLFVIAYYLKNVARESIVFTVSRELALSDQVVRFALEKVDRIDDPAADAAWSTRSTRSLGGDFIDFVRISKRRWFFVLGDISGKGLSASMNMLILKSMIRTFLRVERDFSSLVQKVNAFIKENLPRGTFFAGIFGYFDFEKGALYFINCGVPALFLYSPSFDTFIEVQGEGKVLGFVRDITPHIKPRKLALSEGSVLVACTDGLIDSENIRGDRFGKDRLSRAVHERLGKASREIADGVIEDLFDFTARKQEDDITLLIMKTAGRNNK